MSWGSVLLGAANAMFGNVNPQQAQPQQPGAQPAPQQPQGQPLVGGILGNAVNMLRRRAMAGAGAPQQPAAQPPADTSQEDQI